ncbi:uncharacterized protein EDB91DRAFT_1119409 [Suillus paluster]|uniref:uncharacterized protein n=1 Tax=Suillus paluster TaxID=48578 RepID=UPI001B87804E|nr:uncharacterized protein EDB91DRAFT_1119409 [Suillus paluster]KAG1745912.1 hypothetical protein EDB91DRAFT_1119409 [Suillus paluster]
MIGGKLLVSAPHLMLMILIPCYSWPVDNIINTNINTNTFITFINNEIIHTPTWTANLSSILQPLAGNGTWFTTANGIIRIGIATILVLEYSAFLRHDSDDELGFMKSAVDYYMKSPTAITVEKVAREITDRGHKKEELKTKILEFILENRMSKELLTKK